MTPLRIALAQLNPIAGALDRNLGLVRDALATALTAGADVLLTPEMAVSGYPVEDLLGDGAFLDDVERAVDAFVRDVPAGIVVLLGAPMRDKALPAAGGATRSPSSHLDGRDRDVHNALLHVTNGAVISATAKTYLPEYGVFDDARYVRPSLPGATMLLGDVRVGFAICEDLWSPEVADAAAADGATVLLVANASPYSQGKPAERVELLARTARRTGMTVVYVNAVGAQDEIVFDGGSLVVTSEGNVFFQAPLFEAGVFMVDVPVYPHPHEARADDLVVDRFGALGRPPLAVAPPVTLPTGEAEVYGALVLGLRDYVNNNGFRAVLLGLSGGLDSALAAVLAVDALGADRVWGIGMPGPYSSAGSVDDARALADNLGIRFDVISILDTYEAELALLGDRLAGPGTAVAKENIQARARMLHLMTLSNATGAMLVNTGNKSELSVGYSTLCGDMAGSWSPLRDVYKTLAYRLCDWRNTAAVERGEIPPIPRDTITKPPSAELAPDQVDSSSLPPYEVLDLILEAYLETQASAAAIIARLVADGMATEVAEVTVVRVLTMTDRAEFKRRQGPVGPKVTPVAFGRDRRMPITNRRGHYTRPAD